MSREAKELNLFRIYKLLDHPVRREIIEFLGEEERLGFKEFKERLKINVGALYYHFDTLSGLITQDKDRKYVLTDLGKLAYQFLKSKEGRLMELEVDERARIAGPQNRIFGYAKSIFFPSGFFMNLYQSPKRHLADVILILAFGSWTMIETKLEPILLFFNFGTSLPPTMIVARLLIGVLIIVAISEITGKIFFQRSGGNLSLIIGASFSLLPLFLFPTLLLFEKWGVIILTEPLWVGILQFLLQVWSLCALTSAISLSKGLRMEKAAVISVAVVYLNLGYMYFILHGL